MYNASVMLGVNVSVALLEVFGEAMTPKPWHGVGVEAGAGGVALQAIAIEGLPMRSGRRLVRSADTMVQLRASTGARKENI
jgi:hypothetical protein